MRHAPTASEARLFDALRGGQLGFAVRRQVPVLGRFIADLFVPEVRLVIEVDGGYHTRRRGSDARRDRALVRAGYGVLRLDAAVVMLDVGAAAARVADEVGRGAPLCRGLTRWCRGRVRPHVGPLAAQLPGAGVTDRARGLRRSGTAALAVLLASCGARRGQWKT